MPRIYKWYMAKNPDYYLNDNGYLYQDDKNTYILRLKKTGTVTNSDDAFKVMRAIRKDKKERKRLRRWE